MGFVQKLRMNSLYPGGGVGATGARLDSNPNPYGGNITPPMMPAQINFSQLLALRDSENRDALNRETNILKPRLGQIADQAIQSKKPMGSLPPTGMVTSLDQAKLDMQKRGQDIADRNNQGKLGIADEGLDVKREGQGITRDLGQQRIGVQQQNADTNKGKLDLADWKAKNPDGKIIQVRGGNIHVIDPQSGEAIDTGIPSGTMTEQASITAKGNEARQTKTTIPGRAPVNSNADLPTQQKVGGQLKAQELINTHPEWKNFIKIDPNSGLVIVTPPGNAMFGMGGGPDKAVYDEITKALYPKSSATAPVNTPPAKVANVNTKPSIGAGSTMMEKVQKNSKGETRTVVSTDGGKTWVPKK